MRTQTPPGTPPDLGRGPGTARLAASGSVGDGWNASYLSPQEVSQGLEIVSSTADQRLECGVDLGFIGDVPEDERMTSS